MYEASLTKFLYKVEFFIKSRKAKKKEIFRKYIIVRFPEYANDHETTPVSVFITPIPTSRLILFFFHF